MRILVKVVYLGSEFPGNSGLSEGGQVGKGRAAAGHNDWTVDTWEPTLCLSIAP